MINPFSKPENSRYKDACLSKIQDFTDNQGDSINNWLKNPKGIVLISSPPGVGKTYIAAAITNKRFEERKYCWYFSESDIITKFESMKNDGLNPEYKLQDMCENEFIIWDDMGSSLSFGKNSYTDAEKKHWYFKFLDLRYNSRLPTIITSNYAPKDFETFMHERFVSRIAAEENLVINLLGGDKRVAGM